MIYMDNAATTYRKPEQVYHAVERALRFASGNPGRGGHIVSRSAGQIVRNARISTARLFHIPSAEEVSFGLNATDGLNLAIHGLVKPGSHVVTSVLEHNSVLRPLEVLRGQGVEVSVLQASVADGIDPDDLKKSIRSNTSLVALSHVSNVTGTVNDIREAGKLCREREIPFLVDAAQSAGVRSIDVERDYIDLLAFPGHKGLLGPMGTGGLYVRSGLCLSTLRQGGTGSISESLEMPAFVPDRYESGTVNVPGIAGLDAGIRYILDSGTEYLRKREEELYDLLWEGLAEIAGVTLIGPGPGRNHGSVLSAVFDGLDPHDMAELLDAEFEICVRAGLHCAPLVHGMLGTLDSHGTVRFSPCHMNTEDEIRAVIDAVREIMEG